MKRILNIAAAVLLAAVVLVSCEPGPQGLFAGLEREEPLDKGTAAFNANTAVFVTRVDGATDYYYAAVGATLLRRPVAGTAWETVTVPGAPAGSIISGGVSDSGVLFISFSPANRTIFSYDEDGAGWTSNFQQASLPDVPVQSLLFDGTNLYAATSTSADELTSYTLSYSTGAAFTPIAGITDEPCGKPSSVAVGLGAIWITAGNTIFTGGTPGGLGVYAHVPAGVSDENPVLDVTFDSAGYVIAAGTGSLYSLTAGASTPSGTFGSAERRLSSVIVVPKNGGGNATLVGVKSWASDEYTGYYEYDALLNAGVFSSVVPSSAYDMVSDNSNYVTTLDDLSIEGFYYDDTLGEETLFARTVGKGGLWSNTWNGTAWSGWDRE